MTRSQRRGPGLRLALALLAVGATLAGCDFFDDPSPDTVSFALMEGEGEYQIVLSTVFVAGLNDLGGTRVELIESDTLVVSTPYLDEVDIRGDQRFFIRVIAGGEGVDVGPVRLSVDIDDENRFDRRAEVTDEPIFFLYQFNGQIFTEDIQVF